MNYCINQKAEFMIQQPIRNKNRRALQKMCDKKNCWGEDEERKAEFGFGPG